MVEIKFTAAFDAWLNGLSDRKARVRITARIDRLRFGNPGDVKAVGEGVSELRIDHGPGYRVYFVRRGEALIVVLGGGDKSTQSRDIAKALSAKRGLP